MLSVFGVDPSSLPASIWDPATGTFTSGATVEDFANQIGLGEGTVDHLLTAGNLDNVTLDDLVTGIWLNSDSTTNAVLDKIERFNNLTFGDFASGFGLGSDSTVEDLFTNIPGFDGLTVGGLLGAAGLTDQSTVDDLFKAIPGLDGTYLNGLVSDVGVGNEPLSDLTSSLFGDTTVDQYLTDVLVALAQA